jgi:hypothetical protein
MQRRHQAHFKKTKLVLEVLTRGGGSEGAQENHLFRLETEGDVCLQAST